MLAEIERDEERDEDPTLRGAALETAANRGALARHTPGAPAIILPMNGIRQ